MWGAAAQNLKFFYFLLSEAPATPCLLLENVWQDDESFCCRIQDYLYISKDNNISNLKSEN